MRALVLLGLLPAVAPAQSGCGTVSLQSDFDRSYLVGTSETAGAYRWVVNGTEVRQGAAPQLLLLHADGTDSATDGRAPAQ